MAATPEAERKPWRLFVAIELPTTVREALRKPLDALAPLKDWMRPSPLEQIHLTLHFLGGVEIDRIASVTASVCSAVHQHQRFELSVRGIGAFGGTRRPRVLWAGFAERGLDQLGALRRDTGSALAQLGFEVEPDFKPHLTLARARRPMDGKGQQALQDWYAAWNDAEFGALPALSVCVMRSELGGGPARHSSLASCELQ